MRKGKVMLIPVYVMTVLLLVATAVTLIGCQSKTEEVQSIFDHSDSKWLSDTGVKESLDGLYRIAEASEFGYEGTVEIKADKASIQTIQFTADLSEMASSDIEKATVDFIKAYSEALGLSVADAPTILQFTSDDDYKNRPDDDLEALKSGYVLYEYSYRDNSGTLWIVHIYSPKDEVLMGSVLKLADESGYDGFEPMIDMREEETK